MGYKKRNPWVDLAHIGAKQAWTYAKPQIATFARKAANGAIQFATGNAGTGAPTSFAARGKLARSVRQSSGPYGGRFASASGGSGPGPNRRAVPSRGTGPGRSGGFVKTKRYRKTKASRRRISGVNYTGEFGGSYTDVNMVVVGHSTNAGRVTMKMIWSAVVKHLMIGAQMEVKDFAESLFQEDGTGGTDAYCQDSIFVTFQDRIGQSPNFATVQYKLYLKNLSDIVNWLCDNDRPWNQPEHTNGDGNFILKEIMFKPFVSTDKTRESAGVTYRLDLERLVVKLETKSTFKMQNRTVNDAGEDAEAVDNVPLHGKSYEGAGTGGYWKDQYRFLSTGFIVNTQTGLMTMSRPTNMLEPPKVEEFTGVTRMGKIKLEPGEIKTSTLTSKDSHTIAKWVRMVQPLNYLLHPKSSIGKYRFFAIEKIMDVEGVASINCGYEHNLAITSSVSMLGKKPTTVQLYDSIRNITPGYPA